MKYAYFYIVSCVALVSIGGFAMYHFSVSQSYDRIAPQHNQGTKDCVGHMPQARTLAENSIGQATISSYNFRFDSIRCVFGSGINGTSQLQSIIVAFQSPSGWAIIFTEDPMLTKVINSTVLPPSRFSS